MTSTEAPDEVLPLRPFIKRGPSGEPYIVGSRCGSCEETFVGERSACARCCARGGMSSFRLATTGKVYSFTIVERSFPGVQTPFIDVTVDLDDGTHLKGTLEGVAPSINALEFDMPVELRFREISLDDVGDRRYLGYVFLPVSAAQSRTPR